MLNLIRGSIVTNNKSEIKVPIIASALKNITILPARNMSCCCSACNNRGPIVGRPKTIEVSVAPDTMKGSIPPIELIIGFRAMRTGYLNKIFRSLFPLARAVITYCFANSSSNVGFEYHSVADAFGVEGLKAGVSASFNSDAAKSSDNTTAVVESAYAVGVT